MFAAFIGSPAPAAPHWTLTGWNNLGMHCMDDDFSVFSLLPPFNTVNAQLIDSQGKLVTNPASFTLTYEGIADPSGSINTTSIGKTNFWDYAEQLFGANLALDAGLAGKNMPGLANTPQSLDWDSTFKWFSATGIPITPMDDAGLVNRYPLMRLTAKNASGTKLASVDVVLPVSDEMNCSGCHGSGHSPAAQPALGWAYDPDKKRDHRLNILMLHDEKNADNPTYKAALAANGMRDTGLYDTVTLDGRPILCAACHSSEALSTSGFAGVAPLTTAMHARHATVFDHKSGMQLGDSTNRTSCYQCHPGSTTKCLRGAMGTAVARDGTMAMQCQSCHGTMSEVAATTRVGWLDQPNCQACHTGTATQNSGKIVFDTVFDSPGHIRVPANTTFATNPNTPAQGKSLYRFSTGHGGLQCEACHGSTHAEFATWTTNDNIYSKQVQGHIGKIAECTACHASTPNTVTGGPHGLHPLGSAWASRHGDIAERGSQSCKACHGTDLRGTRLSRAQGDRSLTLEERGAKTFWQGQTIGCYDCHNGPNSDDGAGRRQSHVPNTSFVAAADQPEAQLVNVTAGSGAATSLRIVRQPLHGTVGVEGFTATYFPDPGYVGTDSFTYAATDGYVESNLGTGNVRVVGTVNGQPDFVPPKALKIRPLNKARVKATGFTVRGQARDNLEVAKVEYSLENGPWVEAVGTTNWTATIGPVPVGRVNFQFRITDSSGNVSMIYRRRFVAR